MLRVTLIAVLFGLTAEIVNAAEVQFSVQEPTGVVESTTAIENDIKPFGAQIARHPDHFARVDLHFHGRCRFRNSRGLCGSGGSWRRR